MLKKLLLIALVSVFAFIFLGCSSSTPVVKEVPEVVEEAPAVEIPVVDEPVVDVPDDAVVEEKETKPEKEPKGEKDPKGKG